MKKSAMGKMISAAILLPMTALADEAIQMAPKIDADPTALIICAVLLVVMIGGFFAYLGWKDRTTRRKTSD